MVTPRLHHKVQPSRPDLVRASSLDLACQTPASDSYVCEDQDLYFIIQMPPLLISVHHFFHHHRSSILAASENLNTGESPLEVARVNDHKEVVRLLAAAGSPLKHHLRQNPRFNRFRTSYTVTVSFLFLSFFSWLSIEGGKESQAGLQSNRSTFEEMTKRKQKKENNRKSKVTEFNSEEIPGRHQFEDLDSTLQVLSQGSLLIM